MAVRSETVERREAEQRQRQIMASDPLIPSWMRETIELVPLLGGVWKTAAGIVGAMIALLGLIGMLGGGLASIQAVRYGIWFFASVYGWHYDPSGWPGLGWWLIPVATNAVQIFCRVLTPLRVLWRPSVVFDTVTTAVFGGVVLLIAFQNIRSELMPWEIVICGIISSVTAYGVTILSEKLFFGGIKLAKVAFFT